MATMQQEVDLIEDIWRKIFTSLEFRPRARLFQVCKRWQSILSNPVSWLELDVKFLKESKAGNEASLFKQFVSKYCYQATKVNIEVADTSAWVPLFQAVLSLAQLRYLRFVLDGQVPNEYKGIQWETPKWSNLVYLNLSCQSITMCETGELERILQAAPNLEELYLHRYSIRAPTEWRSIFKPLQKLKSLSVPEIVVAPPSFSFGSSQQTARPEVITEQLPQLQVLYLYRPTGNPLEDNGGGGGFGFGFGQPQDPPSPVCQQHGNTFVVSTDLMKSRDLEMVKRIGPLLKKTNYVHYFTSASQELNPELLDYLFNDLKLDINCTLDTLRKNPFTSDLFAGIPIGFPTGYLCPLSSVLGDVNAVRKMLDLGADPNMPHENMSPFAYKTVTKDSCLLLLERGADVLRKVRGKMGVEHLFDSEKIQDDEMSEIMTAILRKGVYENLVVNDNGTTLLDLAVQHQFEKTARVLVSHGAELTANSMDQLITLNYEWWCELIESGAFDVDKLHLSTVLQAVKKGLFPLVRDCLQNLTQGLDINGYNLAHYICTLLLQNFPSKRSVGKASDLLTTPGSGFGSFSQLPATFTTPLASSIDAVKTKSAEENSMPTNSALLTQLVKELNLDVNVKSATGQTPLLLVCSHSPDDASVVTALIECGARVNEPDSNGWTPLHAALYLHKYDTVKVLLAHDANMSAQDKLGVTPVMAFILNSSTYRNDTDMWTHLLSLDIDINMTDKYMSRNLLHYVCISLRKDFLLALLNKFPDININCPDAHGFTPLHYAAIGLEDEMMKMLIEQGADTNAVTHILRLTPMSVLIAAATPVSPYYRYVKSYNSMSSTAPMILTTSIGPEEHPLEIISMSIPSWLSDKPAYPRSRRGEYSRCYLPLPTDLSIKDQFGNTILHDIVRSADYLRLLLDKNHMFQSAINELWSTPNNFGTTPFHIFAKHTFYSPAYQIETAEETLLKVLEQPHVVDSLNSRDEHGRTGLEYLLEHQSHRPPMSSSIKSALYKMKGLKFIGSSLLHLAIENNCLDNIMLGRIAESDPESLNLKVNGKTPLILFIEKLLTSDYNPHLPVDTAWVKIIDMFLQLKVDLNAQDNQGNTALHRACFFLHLGGWNCPLMHDAHLFSLIVAKLLDAGARVDIANKSGQTVLDIVPNLLELDRSLVHQVKVPPVKPNEPKAGAFDFHHDDF